MNAEQMSAQALIDKGIPETTARTIAHKVHAYEVLTSALQSIANQGDPYVSALSNAMAETARAALAKVSP